MSASKNTWTTALTLAIPLGTLAGVGSYFIGEFPLWLNIFVGSIAFIGICTWVAGTRRKLEEKDSAPVKPDYSDGTTGYPRERTSALNYLNQLVRQVDADSSSFDPKSTRAIDKVALDLRALIGAWDSLVKYAPIQDETLETLYRYLPASVDRYSQAAQAAGAGVPVTDEVRDAFLDQMRMLSEHTTLLRDRLYRREVAGVTAQGEILRGRFPGTAFDIDMARPLPHEPAPRKGSAT